MKQLSVMLKTAVFTSLCFAMISLASCDKTPPIVSCFDQQLYDENKDAFCTADCPGVMGCDGKKYCNSCEAARQGIRVVE